MRSEGAVRATKPQLKRLVDMARPPVPFVLDGRTVQGLEGDTVLVAILSLHSHVRSSEFGDGQRAGFCMMGACQDCWVWTQDGERLRACSTELVAGMSIVTGPRHG